MPSRSPEPWGRMPQSSHRPWPWARFIEEEPMTQSLAVPSLATEAEGWSPQDVLRWALDSFHPRIAFAASFGVEDVAVIDMLAGIRADARVFTLDTGRLPVETYEVMERVRE